MASNRLSLTLRSKPRVIDAELEEAPMALTGEPPSVIELIESVLEERKQSFHFFRPSMLFKCERANVFHYRHAPVSPGQQATQLHRILDTGTVMHSQYQEYLASLKDWWFVPEAKIYRKVEGAWIRGSCDGVLIRRADMFRIGIEIKSINDSGFKSLTKPKEGHAEQALTYTECMGLPGSMLLYLNKNNSSMKEFWVPSNTKIWDATKKKIRRLKTFVDTNQLPEYDPSTCTTNFCSYVEVCRKRGAPV